MRYFANNCLQNAASLGLFFNLKHFFDQFPGLISVFACFGLGTFFAVERAYFKQIWE